MACCADLCMEVKRDDCLCAGTKTVILPVSWYPQTSMLMRVAASACCVQVRVKFPLVLGVP